MKIGNVWTFAILALALLCLAGIAAAQDENGTITADGAVIVDDVESYNGAVGPGSPLYGLKISFEDLDESFTFNETERLNKQMNNARLRLSEVKRELVLNNTDAAGRALDLYWQKVNLTQQRISVFSSSNGTGLLHAQEMVTKHQAVLQNLMISHPNNTGLAQAYNNSLSLEQKFEQKTQVRFERIMEKNNKTIVKAVRLTTREQQRTENAAANQTLRVREAESARQNGGGKEHRNGNRVTEAPSETPVQPTRTPVKAAPAVSPADTGKGKPDPGTNSSGRPKDTGSSSGNGNTGNTGNAKPGLGNGRNT